MLDNRSLSDFDFNNKLKSLLTTDTELPYNHDEENTIIACGLQDSEFIESESVKVRKADKFSQEVEYLEITYTKREIAFTCMTLFKEVSHLKNTLAELALQMMINKFK